LFYGVGELSGAHEAAAAGRSMTGAEHLAQTFGHAVVGCVSASIAGGSCGSGAASAGFAAAAGPLLPGADISAARFVSRMIVGGIGSRLAGDNFANGATSAAFAYLFNDLGREMYSGQGDYPKEAQPRVTTTTRDISAMLPGTDAATSAQEFWIGQNNPLMGTLATLWTPDHALGTLGSASIMLRLGSGVNSLGHVSDYVRFGPTRVPNQLIYGEGVAGSTRALALKGGGTNPATGFTLPYHFHVHRFNLTQPSTWFRYTPTLPAGKGG
jgi:hypothetical protein